MVKAKLLETAVTQEDLDLFETWETLGKPALAQAFMDAPADIVALIKRVQGAVSLGEFLAAQRAEAVAKQQAIIAHADANQMTWGSSWDQTNGTTY